MMKYSIYYYKKYIERFWVETYNVVKCIHEAVIKDLSKSYDLGL